MWLEKNSFFQKAILVIFLLGTASCETENINENFEKKYKNDVKQFTAARTQPNQTNGSISESPKLNFAAPTPEVRISENSNTLEPGSEQYYANVDFEEYSQVQPKEYMPNGSEVARNSSKLPPDMFELNYRAKLSPPFRKSGFEFDLINIPPQDSYGVKTAMSEKEYLLVGNKSLQKSVDQINATKSKEDVEISEILIKEQRQLKRRQKMIKMFGEDSLPLDSAKSKNKGEDVKAKSDAKDKMANKKQDKSADKTTQNAPADATKNKAMAMPDLTTQDKSAAAAPEPQSPAAALAAQNKKAQDNNPSSAPKNAAAEVKKNKN